MEPIKECLFKVFLEIAYLIKDNCYDFILEWWLVSKSMAEQRDSYTQCVESNTFGDSNIQEAEVCPNASSQGGRALTERMLQGITF